MRVIVDTNVAVVANARSPQASPACVSNCVRRLREIQQHHTVVIDDGWQVLREYQGQLSSGGQPGVGDAFLKWVLTNLANPARCEQVHLEVHDSENVPPATKHSEFIAFPLGDDFDGFDRSDHKFVALCLTHHERPPIQNAVDTDWWDYLHCLSRHGVRVDFLCPEMTADRPQRGS